MKNPGEPCRQPGDCVINWDFEQLLVGGVPRILPEAQYVHFQDTGNTGWAGLVDIVGWRQSGGGLQGAGVYNAPSNDIIGFGGIAGTHVLFINGAEVHQTLQLAVQAKTEYVLTANVGGGNGNSDGGYTIALWAGTTNLGQLAAGVDGAPDTKTDGTYTSVALRVHTIGLSDDIVGQKLEIRLGKSKSSQAHYHFVALRARAL